MKKLPIVLFVSVLVLAMLACDFPGVTVGVGSPAPTAAAASPTQVAAPAPAPVDNNPGGDGMNVHQGLGSCTDGVLNNIQQDISRIPVGNDEGGSIMELSWTGGTGFGGFDRALLVLPRMDATHMAFVLDTATVHGNRYCGTMQAIIAYAVDPAHHIYAMQKSAQISSTQRPSVDEIPVVFMDLDGNVVLEKAASKGPSLDFLKAHLEMTH